MTDYIGARQKTPYELYLEALQISRQNQGAYSQIPTISGYERIQQVIPPAPPVSFTRPAPWIVPPAPPRLPPPPQPQPPSIQPPPARGGIFTTIGKGLKRGLGEFGKGMKLGPEGYRQYNLMKEMLPYQRAEEESKFKQQKELYELSPEHKIAQQTLEARNAVLAGTASPQQEVLAGVISKPKPEEEITAQDKAALEGRMIKDYTDKKLFDDVNSALRELSKEGSSLTLILGADGYEKLVTKIIGYWRTE